MVPALGNASEDTGAGRVSQAFQLGNGIRGFTGILPADDCLHEQGALFSVIAGHFFRHCFLLCLME